MKKMNSLEKILREPLTDRKVHKYTVSDKYDQLIKIFEEGEPPAISTGLRTLDGLFKWYPGFTYCFTGYPGSGKSELLNYLSMHYARQYNCKVAMFSPESYPIEALMISLVMVYTGKTLNQMHRNEYEQAMEFIDRTYTILDFEDLIMSHELLNHYSDLRDENHEFFITDPFNYLADLSGQGNMSQNLSAALSRMKKFSVDTKAINCIVEHPKGFTGSGIDKPDASPYTLYGGSMWWNKMDVIVSAKRMENNLVEITSWKVKLQRIVGKPGSCMLTWDNGRYSEVVNYSEPY